LAMQTQFCFHHKGAFKHPKASEIYRFLFTKQELSNTAKFQYFIGLYSQNPELSNTAMLSRCKSVFIPILSYGHESWVMIKTVLSQSQAAEMETLRKVHRVTLRDKVSSCEIRKMLNDKSLLPLKVKFQLRWFSHAIEMSKMIWRCKP